MLLLSWNCHCACATTDELQQQQHYTVPTIIKQLMIPKILNNICRFIWMLFVVVIVVMRSFVCNVKRLSVKQSMKHKWVQIWQGNLLWPVEPPSQSSMDLWKTITPNNFHNRLNPEPLLQLTIDPWKTTTLHQLHDRLTPPLLQSTIYPWKTTTPHKFHR